MKWKPTVLTDQNAQEIWSALRRAGLTSRAGEIPSRAIEVHADAGPVRYALGSHGESRLLLPLTLSDRVPSIVQSATLKVIDGPYTLDGRSYRFLDLTCLSSELDGVFSEVSEEIVNRISQGHSALNACVAVLDEFRTLLIPRSERIDATAIVGLVGELLQLNELLDMSSSAWMLWRGPLGDRHDFRGANLSLEIKTGSRESDDRIHVGSIDQLLEPSCGELCLTRYVLEQVSAGSMCVSELYRLASSKASDPNSLRSLLDRVGCTDPDADEWNTARFELQHRRSYKVNDAFPRIIAPMFPQGIVPLGISSIEYEVDLGAARGSLLTDQETVHFQRRMVEFL